MFVRISDGLDADERGSRSAVSAAWHGPHALATIDHGGDSGFGDDADLRVPSERLIVASHGDLESLRRATRITDKDDPLEAEAAAVVGSDDLPRLIRGNRRDRAEEGPLPVGAQGGGLTRRGIEILGRWHEQDISSPSVGVVILHEKPPTAATGRQDFVPEPEEMIRCRSSRAVIKSFLRSEAGGELVPHLDAEHPRIKVEHGQVIVAFSRGMIQGDAAAVGVEQASFAHAMHHFPVECRTEDLAPGTVRSLHEAVLGDCQDRGVEIEVHVDLLCPGPQVKRVIPHRERASLDRAFFPEPLSEDTLRRSRDRQDRDRVGIFPFDSQIEPVDSLPGTRVGKRRHSLEAMRKG